MMKEEPTKMPVNAIHKLAFAIIIGLFMLFVDVSAALIVNDDLCEDHVPHFVVTVWNAGRSRPRTVYCGQIIEMSGIGNTAPTIRFADANKDKWYTLLMVDPDAPSPANPSSRFWLHWIVTGIQGESLADHGTDIYYGDTVTEYNPPSPPAGSGPHRYQFFLYEHTEQLDLTVPSTRRSFDPQTYATDNELGTLKADFQFVTENP